MHFTPSPIDVTPRQLASLVDHHLASDVPLFVIGDPGQGKSRILEQRISAADYRYTDFRCAILDLPDLQGYPILESMRPGEPCQMTAAPGLPSPHSSDRHAIVYEELTGASRMMQGALYGQILERRGLPKHNRVFATGNPASARGVTIEMPTPLRSRFSFCRLILCPDEIMAHATDTGWHPFVTAYHTMTKGAEWSNFDPKSTEETYACPRSWEDVSRKLQAGNIPPDLLTQMLAGSLGYGIGQKFASFVRLYSELGPTIATMKTDPDNTPIPEDAAAQWFLAATIASSKAEAQANPLEFARWAIPFICRMPDELCVFAMNAVTRHTPQLGKTPEFIKRFATNARFAALAQFCK